MLVLTLRKEESVLIGEDVAILVVRDNAGQVGLGIVAPRNVPIVRAEVPHRTTRAEAELERVRRRRRAR